MPHPTSRPRSATTVHAAVDLGAGSGRVITGLVGRERLETRETHRFANTPLRLPSGLHWNLPGLHQEILDGLRRAARTAPAPFSVGIDSWAVDYGLLDADGTLLGLPHHYRDPRTATADTLVHSRCTPEELYAVSGLQHLPFNTVYQLAVARGSSLWPAARTLLLVPDLLVHWLTGTVGAEETNASTTGLLDARTGQWSGELISRLDLPRSLFPALRRPGEQAGALLPHVAAETGLPPTTEVTTVASHDTASAVAAVPAADGDFGYVSCGTWSLAGLELDAPVLTPGARQANFTNERGVDGTVRFLRNTMGLWLLEECRREWQREGSPEELPALLAQAARAEPFAAVLDADDPVLLAPGDMPGRIAALLRSTGQRPPQTRGALVRCILESLALAHRRTLRRAAELSGRHIDRVHLVGGGARNELLCQWTADATGLPLTAGPAEATALGNLGLQARAHGTLGDLAELRALVAATQPLRHHEPAGPSRAWEAAAARLGG
ncbi:rhamnulokinase family protein [Streptomyces sp. NPDC059740]|uniref:rhamnulokinase n=1 Tax=Streptomyces sp. NPDC059740 TaxID=3346926 RepID=UPI00365651CE